MKFHSILSQFACSYATSNTLYVFESSTSLTCVRLYNNIHCHRHHFWYRNRNEKIKKEVFFWSFEMKWKAAQKRFFHLSFICSSLLFSFSIPLFPTFGWRKRDFSSDTIRKIQSFIFHSMVMNVWIYMRWW